MSSLAVLELPPLFLQLLLVTYVTLLLFSSYQHGKISMTPISGSLDLKSQVCLLPFRHFIHDPRMYRLVHSEYPRKPEKSAAVCHSAKSQYYVTDKARDNRYYFEELGDDFEACICDYDVTRRIELIFKWLIRRGRVEPGM